jgi:hypothetical protein
MRATSPPHSHFLTKRCDLKLMVMQRAQGSKLELRWHAARAASLQGTWESSAQRRLFESVRMPWNLRQGGHHSLVTQTSKGTPFPISSAMARGKAARHMRKQRPKALVRISSNAVESVIWGGIIAGHTDVEKAHRFLSAFLPWHAPRLQAVESPGGHHSSLSGHTDVEMRMAAGAHDPVADGCHESVAGLGPRLRVGLTTRTTSA